LKENIHQPSEHLPQYPKGAGWVMSQDTTAGWLTTGSLDSIKCAARAVCALSRTNTFVQALDRRATSYLGGRHRHSTEGDTMPKPGAVRVLLFSASLRTDSLNTRTARRALRGKPARLPGPGGGGEAANRRVSPPMTWQRMYQLIRQPKPIDDRQFEIEFLDAGPEVFAFTFG
jgi:hypothetical protein